MLQRHNDGDVMFVCCSDITVVMFVCCSDITVVMFVCCSVITVVMFVCCSDMMWQQGNTPQQALSVVTSVWGTAQTTQTRPPYTHNPAAVNQNYPTTSLATPAGYTQQPHPHQGYNQMQKQYNPQAVAAYGRHPGAGYNRPK